MFAALREELSINVRPCNIAGESVDCFTLDGGPVGSANVEEVGSQPSANGFGNVCDESHGEGGEQEVKVRLDGGSKHSRNRPKLQKDRGTDSLGRKRARSGTDLSKYILAS